MSATTLLHWVGWFLLASWAFFLLRIGLSLARATDGTLSLELRKTCVGLVIMAAGWAFVGFVFIAIGLGAMFPRITAIAGPLACPEGQFELVSQAYSYRPGQSGVTRNALCIYASGESEVVTGSTIFYAGLVYTAVLMTLWAWLTRLGLIGPKKLPNESDEAFNNRIRRGLEARLITSGEITRAAKAFSAAPAPPDTHAEDVPTRLKKLKNLYETGLIDSDTYAAKQADILKSL